MHIGPTRHSKNGARMYTNEGRKQDGASLFPFSAVFCHSCISFFRLRSFIPLCCTINMCKCLFSVVWQPLFYGPASVRRAQYIWWLTKPNYTRLLPFHRGSQSQTVLKEESGVCFSVNHTHTMTSLHMHTLFIFTYALALASQLVIQNS